MSLYQVKDSLKGQKTNSPRHCLGYRLYETISSYKDKNSMIQMLMPFQGKITLNVHIPKAMSWADCLKPL